MKCDNCDGIIVKAHYESIMIESIYNEDEKCWEFLKSYDGEQIGKAEYFCDDCSKEFDESTIKELVNQ